MKFDGPITFWRYRPVLPPVKVAVSLGEGGTPLWVSERLGSDLGLENLKLKDETRNPTSSFKDRSASLIVSDAVGRGFDTLVSATRGNHGASLAAYSATEGLTCHLIVPSNMDIGKLAQMIAYDAEVDTAGDNIEHAISQTVDLAERTGWYQATTELNPLSTEALKTISYELVEQGDPPDWVVVAMGSGQTLYAVWKGFKELEEMGKLTEMPRLIGVQAEGCSPITDAFSHGDVKPSKLEAADTVAKAILNSEPMYGSAALEALKESDGISVTVTDDEMLRYGKEIARLEGIFAEPASAAAVACLPNLLDEGIIDPKDSIISLITSSGLKTNDIFQSLSSRRRSPGLGSKLATKEHLLKNISRSKTYGYELWKGMGKKMTLGAVYQHLSDLEEKGLIVSQTEGKRRYLLITEKGRRVLTAMDELTILL
ncbi:threonine synthase [Candidatus Bathyarchaeota archaeon]|nr:threonine synthase [Candidatus Bathyarchaeota archaeon]